MDCLQLLEKNYWTKEGLPNSYCDSCFLFHSIFLSDLSISLSRPLFIFINIFLSFSNTIYIFVYPSFSLSLSLSLTSSLSLSLSLIDCLPLCSHFFKIPDQTPYAVVEMGGASSQVSQMAPTQADADAIPQEYRFSFDIEGNAEILS